MEVSYSNITKNLFYKKRNRRVCERYFIDKIIVGHFIYLHDVCYKITNIISCDLYENVFKFTIEEEKEK